MPILLNEIGKQFVKEYTPKFFNSKLTGAGKRVGLLNKDLNPANAKKKNSMVDLGYNSDIEKKKYTNGLSEVTCIPLYTIPFYSEHEIKEIPPKDLDTSNMVQIATHSNSTKILFGMEPRYIILEEIQPSAPSGKISKDVTICYDMFFYMDKNLQGDIETVYNTKLDSFETYVKGIIPLTTNKLHRMMCTDIYDTLAKAYEILKNAGYDVDVAAADDYLGDYSVYERICKLSERWQTKIHEDIELLLTNMYMAKAPHSLSAAAQALSHLEKYAVPLDLYKNIYKSITNHFDSDIVEMLCKQNLNLLLSSTLDNLNKNKSTLVQLSAPATPPAIDPMFSTEQIKAITTTEPLALVQAGAGSGKSTVVLARIKYMVDCGVAPEDITVLSFTNAAADNITAKNPNVHSMTIAKMIHLIYSTNFADHELSSLDTIINSLDIEYPNDPFAYDFRKKLSNLRKNDNNCFTEMNDFIEKNYDEVIAVLDRLGQTTLELEIIICYQKISQFTEPPEVQSKYLIIDEVQDNSIFEFIYALKYIEKHKESLFMVGDCSQTLYEFRASNPKALNTLEGSGVFATYQLQTNYRSNQEILDFANVTLAGIEANQYAQIQLKANSLAPTSIDSFHDRVKLEYLQLRKKQELPDHMLDFFVKNGFDYIEEKIKAGEQVALLAYTKKNVMQMAEIVKKHFPNAKIANLVPEQVYNSTIFTSYIKRYDTEMAYLPFNDYSMQVSTDIMNRLDMLVLAKSYDSSKKPVAEMLYKWRCENAATVNEWYRQFTNQQLSKKDFVKNVQKNMVQFEIMNNAIRQSLASKRNQDNKEQQNIKDANILLSTIHSAKGLEFDNTIVLYQADNKMIEPNKRMYYVAFTRAMKSEYILAYDTVVNPKIVADYEAIENALINKGLAQADLDDDITDDASASALTGWVEIEPDEEQE